MSVGGQRSRVLSGSFAPRGTIIQTDKRQRRIHLNVGGEKHSPYVSTLKNVPDSPLAWIIREECKANLDYDPVTDVYFFDRHPGIFAQVLNYFQTGKLHCPRDVCGPMFQAELHYWGIDETQMEACCWPNYTKHREIQENLRLFHNITTQSEENDDMSTDGQTAMLHQRTKWNQYQKKIWEILDEPYSSKTAKIFAYVSLGFIVLSIITYSVMTMESITKKNVCLTNQNTTSNTTITSKALPTNGTICHMEETLALKIIRGLEIVLVFWFTVEILLRFTFCPNKYAFMKEFSNWVDFLAVIPVYLLIIFDASETIMIFNMVRYVRIFRFFKLLYDLHILGKTLQASMNQLVVMVLILCVPAVIFSSIVYLTEQQFGSEKSKKDFADIPRALWWSVVTMTTVGYGLVTPYSALGRIFGGFAAIIGILIVSMTATVIGSSFQQYYQVARTQLKIPAKNRKTLNLDDESTLLGLLRQMEKKPGSIQSDDSKDSGYGRSPIPAGTDSENSTSTPPLISKERNVVVSIDGRPRRAVRRETTLI